MLFMTMVMLCITVDHDNNNEYDDDNDDDVGKRCHCPDWEAGGAGWATLFISQVTFSFKWNVSKCIINVDE